MEKTMQLYMVTRVEVRRMLCLSFWGSPSDINTVLMESGIMMRSETGPCQDKAPRTIMAATNSAVRMRPRIESFF